MNLYELILKTFGWKVEVSTPYFKKSIICVAPHTSNWDFILGELAIRSVKRKSGFLMKEAWFAFPLGYIFRALGGIPVPKKKGSDLTNEIIKRFNESESMTIAITPEGTRKKVSKWRTGFLYIANGANVPVQLASIDYSKKEIKLNDVFQPTGNIEADIASIKEFYKGFSGKRPEKFSVEPQ